MAFTLDRMKLEKAVTDSFAGIERAKGEIHDRPCTVWTEELFQLGTSSIQAGLWAAYPGLCSSVRTGPPILELLELSDGRRCVIFTVEEGNIPGIEPLERCFAMVMENPTQNAFLGFGTARLNVLPEMAGLMGVKANYTPSLLVDTNGKYRVDRMLEALVASDRKQPNILRLRRLVESLAKGAWGASSTLKDVSRGVPIPPSDQAFVASIYDQLLLGASTHEAVREQWWTWADTQGLPLRALGSGDLQGFLHTLPSGMFEAVWGAAQQGWSPLLPHWQSIHGYNYNMSWTGPCSGGVNLEGPTRKPLTRCECKLLYTPAVSGYTLDGESVSNQFEYPIPPQWVDIYVAVMQELAATPAPRTDLAMMEHALRQTAQCVPTLIIDTTGLMGLYKVQGKLNERRIGAISMTPIGILEQRCAPHLTLNHRQHQLTEDDLVKQTKRLVATGRTLVGQMREQLPVETSHD